MKNKNLIIIFILLLFFIVGCKDKTTDTDILEKYASTVSFDETLDSDLELLNVVTYEDCEINITWESSDQNILTNEGKYYYTLTDELVSLNASFTYDGNTIFKTFEFMSYANVDFAFSQVLDSLNIPSSTDTDLVLSQSIRVGKSTYRISYESEDEDIIDSSGVIKLSKEEKETVLKVTISNSKYTKTFNKTIKVLKINEEALRKELEKLQRLSFIDDTQLDFVRELTLNGKKIRLYWSSDHKDIISDSGEVYYCDDETIGINLTISTDFDVSYTFTVNLAPISNSRSLELALEKINIPSIVTSDIILSSSYLYGASATWSSSNQNIISNDGKIGNVTTFKEVSLNLTLTKGNETMEKEFKVNVCKEDHFYKDCTFEGTKENVEVKNGKLVLKEGATEGYYLSNEIDTKAFKSIVGSYAAISDTNRTCELEVKVKAGGKWSKFFSYGAFGLGLENKCLPQSDTYVNMREDEIIVKEGSTGTAFQFKLTLRRNSLSDESPVVSLVAAAIELVESNFTVDISNLPKEVKYDVPKLYQQIVPGIGDSICSPTSSTMLLKYKGHDFSSKAVYEHEYIARLFNDYGNDIFGNWVYNTIGMSAYGEITYVKRFMHINELIQHLALVGPVAASIKGKTITNLKTYTTGGHLLVVTGYKIDSSNNVIFYINDPNVQAVSVEMTMENFLNVYRLVSYIVE